jgi:hypothetical protein
MTEEEWLTSAESTPMLMFLRRKARHRKFRLLACACCRRNELFMSLPGAHEVVAAAERWAEGNGTREEVSEALQDLDLSPASPAFDRSGGAMELGFRSEDGYIAATYTVAWATDDEPISEQLLTNQFRDIFGNPFRPVTFDPEWRTTTALALAHGIYDERAFDRLPILADALQDAGCNNDDILTHLRDTATPHVRGCWALDLVVGKS